MSRALDSSVKEALKHAENEPVFLGISAALGQRLEDLLEIEILGRTHPTAHASNALQDGNAIGIPKIGLVQAFIVSYTKFKDYLRHDSDPSVEDIRKFTGVMLLMDPEHITAANIRKRVITRGLGSTQANRELLLDEKYFIDSLLTSHLHRHTKSPNLWNHRRWLMDCLYAAGLPVDATQEIRNIVFLSGQRHPRNFYAWCHARYLLDKAEADSPTLSTVIVDTKIWCFSHHDDVSGWAFLAYLLERCPEHAMSVFDETLKLTEALRWRNESVWYFLCVLVPGDHVSNCRHAKLRPMLEGLQQEGDSDSMKWPFLERVHSWMKLKCSMS